MKRAFLNWWLLYNGRSWLTFKKPILTGDSSLNHTMKMDEQEAMDLLDEIFTEFHLETRRLGLQYLLSRQ
ncbi:DUF1493 family protein [Serratia odorifera]|uniref:DUF1493 family protein n=1 Tax=Serratia odorifera TaxID=618 RepID=UPI003BB2002F